MLGGKTFYAACAAAILALVGISARAADDGSGIFFPEKQIRLYQTHHGEPAGYPGCLPDVKDDKGDAKYPQWGQPEPELYPGSVEHYRCASQKYLPSWPLFEATSRVKNFTLSNLPEAKGLTEDYAEPVCYVPMYGMPKDTGKHNPPVKVVRMKAGAPNFKLDLGALDQGLYCIRLIGAAETQFTAGIRQPVYVELKVNDGANGETSRYRKRCGYVDEFYSIAEFYFYAPVKRAYAAEMSLGEGTAVNILAYNIDLHDMYTGIVRKPVKQRVNTFDLATRNAQRAEFKARLEARDQAWLAEFAKNNMIKYPVTRPFRPAPLTGEARRTRDDDLWYALPPMNAQTYGQYGTAPRGPQTPEAQAAAAEAGKWSLAGKWDSRWELHLVKDRLVVAKYTYDDLVAHKPLPEPWPFREDAGGLTMKAAATPEQVYPTTLCTIAWFTTQRITEFTQRLTGRAANFAGLADFYHLTGDTEAARDAAMALLREAYLLPAWDESRLSVNAAIVGRTPDLNWGGKDQWTTRRLTRTDAGLYNQEHLETYDRLFDFIQGNQELAQAAGRYIPWIKTPEDVVTFLDTNLIQYTAKRKVRWHLHNNDLFGSVMAAGNTDFTRPWMEFLFRETYVLPMARAGMPDYAITSTERDGTSYIGSWFYAMGGGVAMQYAERTSEYIARRGDKKFDMSDVRRFPKAVAALNFQIEGRAAGLHPLGIGDVNNPRMPYGHWFTLGMPEHQARLGWKWTGDPKYAYILANYFGARDETPQEWAAIQKAAQGVPNPWFAQRSRVLATWAAILEGGTRHTDFRYRRAAMIRVGWGWGHQHNDVLDLIAWCHGVIHAAVGGERPEQRQLGDIHEPKNQTTYTHNMVEVDGDGSHRTGQYRGYSWTRTLKDMDGIQYAMAEASPSVNQPYLTLYRRQAALVDLNEGIAQEKEPADPKEFNPAFKLPKAQKTPDAYLFDVFRIAGGRRHTYCFHGCEEDEFSSNALNVHAVGFEYGANADAGPEAHYLRRFIVADSKTAGRAPAVLQATWRLQREGPPIELTQPEKDAAGVDQPKVVKSMTRGNTERGILGPNYDPSAPRKYTRLHLLDHEGDPVMTGRWVATSPNVTLQCLFVQHDLKGGAPEGQPGNLETVFPAVIEMYEGAPVIASARSVAVAGNEQDALRAVAVELTVSDGRRDVCFSDGRPEKERALDGGIKVAGEFASVSTDDKGLRMAHLVGGTMLQSPGAALTAAAPARTGIVTAVDYFGKTVEIAGMALSNPALVKGASLEIGSADHKTSYMVASAVINAGKVTLTLDKGGDFYSSRIEEVSEKDGVVTCGLGFPTDDSVIFPGMSRNLVASNEALTKFWRAEYLGGTREAGYNFKLSGGAVTAADFGEKGGLRIWEFGVGDEVRIPTHVAIVRDDAGRYVLQADVACSVTIGNRVEKFTDVDLGFGRRVLGK